MTLINQTLCFTQKILSRRARLGIRDSDTFIMSYPKSGGSWFYTLIANGIQQQPGNPLTMYKAAKVIPDINDLNLGHQSLDLFNHMDDPRFFFTHTPFTSRLKPLLPKVLYVMRDVRDVLVSYYHWQKMRRPGFDLSLSEMIASDDFGPCRWDEHVKGWLELNCRIDVHVVRYEDLLTDTAGELGKALEFCGVSRDEKHIQRAVDACQFDRMQKAEERNSDYQKTKIDKAERFVRKGKAGGWKEELDDQALQILIKRYGETMQRYGYV